MEPRALHVGGHLTVGQWLDEWLVIIQRTRKLKTHDTYTSLIRVHCGPLRRTPLTGVTVRDIDDLLHRVARRAPQSAVSLHRILRSAFNTALKRGLVAANPCAHAVVPRVQEQELEPYSLEECRRLLVAAATSPNIARWSVALPWVCTRARCSVCSGATWTSPSTGSTSDGRCNDSAGTTAAGPPSPTTQQPDVPDAPAAAGPSKTSSHEPADARSHSPPNCLTSCVSTDASRPDTDSRSDRRGTNTTSSSRAPTANPSTLRSTPRRGSSSRRTPVYRSFACTMNRACSRDQGPAAISFTSPRLTRIRHRRALLPRSPYVTTTRHQEALSVIQAGFGGTADQSVLVPPAPGEVHRSARRLELQDRLLRTAEGSPVASCVSRQSAACQNAQRSRLLPVHASTRSRVPGRDHVQRDSHPRRRASCRSCCPRQTSRSEVARNQSEPGGPARSAAQASGSPVTPSSNAVRVGHHSSRTAVCGASGSDQLRTWR